jgi:cytochrome c biogenesis protein
VKDPGKQYALIGSILAIIGLMISLFVRSRRIWLRREGDRIVVAGLALNRLPGLEEEIAELVRVGKKE